MKALDTVGVSRCVGKLRDCWGLLYLIWNNQIPLQDGRSVHGDAPLSLAVRAAGQFVTSGATGFCEDS